MSKMILIAGATGKTGRILTEKILEAGQNPVALVRDSSDTSALPKGTLLRNGDLTDLSGSVCKGVDVVVFAAGSGGDTDAEMTEKVDRDGAIRLIDIAKSSGVQRFVMLSSFGAHQSDPTGDLAHYLKAKHDADAHLQASGLTYGILRPVALDDGESSNAPVLGKSVDPKGKAFRADVAQVLAEAAIHGVLDGRAVDMQSG